MAGKGSFAAVPEDVSDGRREELLEKLKSAVQELRYLGMTTEEICEILKKEEDER